MREKILVKTFAGLELLLQEELIELGGLNCTILSRAVQCEGDIRFLYRVNYFSRLALRVLLQVKEFVFRNNKEYYDELYNVEVEKFLEPSGTLAISATMHQSIFKTPLYASLLAKDAFCDRFRHRYDQRPSVDKEQPDVQFHIHIFENKATLYLDSSGDSLHKRGYRISTHPAALNEVVAAAIIKHTGWKADCDVIDFMCGSATLLIEAAMIALNIPAGFYRQRYGFFSWLTFNQNEWKKVKAEADIKEDVPIDFYGYDISGRYLGMAAKNIEKARLTDFIKLKKQNLIETHPARRPTLIVLNPPYGERLNVDDIGGLYKQIGDTLKKNFSNCTAWIISSDTNALKQIGLHASRKITLFNGALECKLMKFELYEGRKYSAPSHSER